MNEFNKSTDSNKFSKDEIMKYFCNLDESNKKDLIDRFKSVNECFSSDQTVLVKILNMHVDTNIKKSLLNKLESINSSMSDNNKLKTWLDNALRIPFGVYTGIDLTSIKKKKIPKFLDNLKTSISLLSR